MIKDSYLLVQGPTPVTLTFNITLIVCQCVKVRQNTVKYQYYQRYSPLKPSGTDINIRQSNAFEFGLDSNK